MKHLILWPNLRYVKNNLVEEYVHSFKSLATVSVKVFANTNPPVGLVFFYFLQIPQEFLISANIA